MTPDGGTGPVRLFAHAKLTLALRVLGRRDDGYHEIEALAVSLADLADQIEVTLQAEPGFTLRIAGVTDGVPRDAANLAVQAALLLLSRVQPGVGAQLALQKSIPPGSGLGGGSADAAAVLRGVARLLPEETEGLDLAALGAELGSDVPFCVQGGMAWMRGRGEIVDPVAPVEGWRVVIAVPPFPVPTAAVYAAWDSDDAPSTKRSAPAPPALSPLVGELANDLEPAACRVEPRLAEFRARLEEATGRPPVLAGSGSAYFVAVDDSDEAQQLARRAGAISALAVVSAPAHAGVTFVRD